MSTVVAIYRGIEIYRSKTLLCLDETARPTQIGYEAHVNGWLVIGSLEGLRKHIDSVLGPNSSPSDLSDDTKPEM